MRRAKEKVLLDVNNHSHDLQLLENYITVLNAQNPGSWCSFELDDGGRFLRTGISLKSWDESFKNSQNTIFIDGTFLNGPWKGILLSAIALNGNNEQIVLGFAIVSIENAENWTWFLRGLRGSISNSKSIL